MSLLTIPYFRPRPRYFGRLGIIAARAVENHVSPFGHSRLICDINLYAPSTITIDINEYKTSNGMEPLLFVK